MKPPYRELVTINGKNVVLAHDEPPVVNAGVLENSDIFRMINIFADKFSPSNIDKADGTPLRLYTSDRVKIDVSKRRKHDMGFWHRNIDAHEIIFCVKGALKWETEMGVKIMHPGDMLIIPKGIGHRSMLCEDSTDENVLIELKIADELTYVGESSNLPPEDGEEESPAVRRVGKGGHGAFVDATRPTRRAHVSSLTAWARRNASHDNTAASRPPLPTLRAFSLRHRRGEVRPHP